MVQKTLITITTCAYMPLLIADEVTKHDLRLSY